MMHIQGIGVDMVSFNHKAFTHQTFIKKTLSEWEYQTYLKTPKEAQVSYVASRFAAKEAYLKARHVGIGAIPFKTIEVRSHPNGAPYFYNDANAHLSITHEQAMAIAFVLIEGEINE